MPQASFALGFIETQGFTAVFEAIDTACKAANVEVIGKEKLGGGYVTVVIKGDLSAVTAAIAAGQVKVEGLGKLIAAHVIAPLEVRHRRARIGDHLVGLGSHCFGRTGVGSCFHRLGGIILGRVDLVENAP